MQFIFVELQIYSRPLKAVMRQFLFAVQSLKTNRASNFLAESLKFFFILSTAKNKSSQGSISRGLHQHCIKTISYKLSYDNRCHILVALQGYNAIGTVLPAVTRSQGLSQHCFTSKASHLNDAYYESTKLCLAIGTMGLGY